MLHAVSVGKGDRVAIQLPERREFLSRDPAPIEIPGRSSRRQG